MKHKRRLTLIILLATIIGACFLIRATDISTKIDEVIHLGNDEVEEMTDEEEAISPVEEEDGGEVKEETVIEVKPPVVVTKPTPQKTCYVGGCSSQVCSDSSDVMTTCEYKEEYACYKQTTCEVQASGECGWTETKSFAQCLSSSGGAV